jgi:uncharacterized protein (UPF0147 family)
MVDYKPIIELLDRIINDKTIPKNIRAAAENAKNSLNSNDPEEVKIAAAIHALDEVSNDPNMPVYARTKIWNVVSMLELARKEASI